MRKDVVNQCLKLKRWMWMQNTKGAFVSYFLYAQKYIVENISLKSLPFQSSSLCCHQGETHAELCNCTRYQVFLETQCLASWNPHRHTSLNVLTGDKSKDDGKCTQSPWNHNRQYVLALTTNWSEFIFVWFVQLCIFPLSPKPPHIQTLLWLQSGW